MRGMAGEGETSPFRYHLELNPRQLKITHTALRALADGFGHDEAEVHVLIQEVLSKLPDEHAIRAIQLDREPSAPEVTLSEVPEPGLAEAPEPDADAPEERPPEDDLPPTIA